MSAASDSAATQGPASTASSGPPPCWQCDAPTDGAALCPVCAVVQPPGDRDPFDRLGLPVTMALDADALQASRLALLDAVHPDRFVDHRDAARRHALAQAVAINDAARAIADPLDRAATLLRLRRWPVDSEPSGPDQLALAEYAEAIAELCGRDAHPERQILSRTLVADVEATHARIDAALTGDDRVAACQGLARLSGLRRLLRRLDAQDTTPDRTGRIRR